MRFSILICVLVSLSSSVSAQEESVAQKWNELLLESIRNDLARPTVHARNLFHHSIALYDSWAVLDTVSETYLLGKNVNGYICEFGGIATPQDIEGAREECMSYASYRLLRHRFTTSPGGFESLQSYDSLMTALGYDFAYSETDYSNGSFAALGNYLAENLIAFGLNDGSNELGFYDNQYYEPLNEPLLPMLPGNPDMEDPNRWQPLTLQVFIDQSGNVFPINTPPFLSPEWGEVSSFALNEEDLTILNRDGYDYWIYHDPGLPPLIDTINQTANSELYKWNMELVSIWSSHLTTDDGVYWDVSPATIGNIQNYPVSLEDHLTFYNLIDGGDPSIGHDLNPATGQPYDPQLVKRGDYARILAEFWADGPDSETPPGHWFTILNYVNNHPLLEKRFEGQGEELNDLEWDVKSYFALAGAMHDAAISAWGIKGYYDYVRPISALRFMAELGQCTNPNLDNYHLGGITLREGFIEIVEAGDALAGIDNENVGKIKVYTWRGHDFISNTETDVAGVGWILAENWWPYQRPSFVTPNFAGYVSGHSTFSRAAAELLTAFTGDEFFPGGMGEFEAPMNEFLVFEDGPSEDVTLQWATYRDASDQCSLSRIWGGIHPPADDIPGRLIGIEVGLDAFELAKQYFEGQVPSRITELREENALFVYPNPAAISQLTVTLRNFENDVNLEIINSAGQLVFRNQVNVTNRECDFVMNVGSLEYGIYLIRATDGSKTLATKLSVIR